MSITAKHADLATGTTTDPRWPAVVARSAEADGTFFYSVRTTGVYCRPSWTARLARPENVRVHATRADAERAGFRPCRRCKPDSNGRFSDDSGKVVGMAPTTYRAAGVNAEIRVAIAECSLGLLLVAKSERGVCAIHLGNDRDALARELQGRFPQATLLSGDAELEYAVTRVVGLVEAPRLGLDLPLDVRGTAFQQRVWQALREIPAGTTATYTEIAGRIGTPSAVRAVAGACAANPLAVAIPCHRVVRSDGGLSGYRWGVERKRALLQREAGA